jgi:hypothetical protein
MEIQSNTSTLKPTERVIVQNPQSSAPSAIHNSDAKSASRIAFLSATRLGTAFGMTGVIFYLGCIITMSTVSQEKSILFFNSLLHGFDVAPILRTNVPASEACLGIASTFVLGWFAGALIACFYNWSLRR